MKYGFFKYLLLLSLMGLLLPGSIAEESFNGVQITLLPGLGGGGGDGYQEHTFMLQNNSEKPSKVTISIDAGRSHYYNYLESISRTVTLSPGAKMQAVIPQPPLMIPNPKPSLSVNGQYFDNDSLRINMTQFNAFAKDVYHRGTTRLDFLVSQSIPPNANGNIFSIVPPTTSTSGSKGFDPKDVLKFGWSILPVEQWSSNWLAYTPYRAIIVTIADLDKMPPAAAEALQKYAASGGMLIVFTPPPQTNATGKTETIASLESVGFGSVVHYNKAPATFNDADWGMLYNFVESSAQISRIANDQTNESMVNSLPVMNNVRVPVRQLFIIMLLFFFIIGPLNIYILNRKKKMIWILWTTPLIAFAFALLVVAYSLLAEGWHTRARNNTITILDENTQLAATLGIQGFYCPLAPRNGLNYADSAMVMPFANNTSQGRTVDWSDGQNLVSGWTRPRIPAYLFIRQVEQRRERLKVNYTTPTEAEIVNGTGAKLNELKLAGQNGIVYIANGEIQPGEKVILKATGRRTNKILPPNHIRKITDNISNNIRDFSRLDSMLITGSYCAKMEHTPFLPPGVKPGELIEESFIFGILQRDGGAK